MAGFKIITDGFDRGTRQIAANARRNVRTYGDHVAGEYARTAKHDAPWTDRRGVARRGIASAVTQTGDKVTVRMGASAANYKRGAHSVKDYMEYLEFDNKKKYAVVFPTVKSMRDGVVKGFGNAALTGVFVKVERDKAAARVRARKYRAKQREARKK